MATYNGQVGCTLPTGRLSCWDWFHRAHQLCFTSHPYNSSLHFLDPFHSNDAKYMSLTLLKETHTQRKTIEGKRDEKFTRFTPIHRSFVTLDVNLAPPVTFYFSTFDCSVRVNLYLHVVIFHFLSLRTHSHFDGNGVIFNILVSSNVDVTNWYFGTEWEVFTWWRHF